MERRAFGVQSIICIYCKKKNNSAFKCLVSRVIRRVPSLAGRLREAEYESLGMLSATLPLPDYGRVARHPLKTRLRPCPARIDW